VGLIVLVVACAAVVAVALGGRPAALGDLPVRRWALLVAALLVQVAGTLAGLAGLPQVLVTVGPALVSGALAAVFCVANVRAHGIAMAGLGLLCNVLVTTVNGAMPVSLHAAQRAGVDVSAVGDDARHEPAGAGTLLRPLGDVVPVPLPGRPEVVSVGDLLLAAGAAQFVLWGMLGGAVLASGGTGPGGGRRAPEGSDRAASASRPDRRPAERRTGRVRPEPSRRDRGTLPGDRRQRARRERPGRPAGAYRARGEVIEVESELVRVITHPNGSGGAAKGADAD
jgi:hypothetical protein